MNLEDNFKTILNEESLKNPSFSNEIGGLSAWNSETVDLHNRKTLKTSVCSSVRTQRASPRYTKIKFSARSKEKTPDRLQDLRPNIFRRVSPTFTSYINSIIAKNSQFFKKESAEKQKKLEVISVKLQSNIPGKRIKSCSPEKNRKNTQLPKFIGESFLINQKEPPSVLGYRLTVYPKVRRNRLKTEEAEE